MKSPTAKSVKKVAKTVLRRVKANVAAKRPAMKRPGQKPTSAVGGAKRTASDAVRRVTRVAKEVAEQATHAVTDGVESLKELGETIVERVTG